MSTRAFHSLTRRLDSVSERTFSETNNMIALNYLRCVRMACTVAIAAAGLLLTVTAEAKTRKGAQFLKQGMEAEAKKDYDKALDFYNQAVDTSPSDITYLLYQRRVRFQAGQKHVDAGRKLRIEGKVEEALKEFQQAVLTDPSSQVAMQEIRRTFQALDADKQQPAGSDRGLTPVERAKKDTEQRLSSMMSPPPRASISSARPVTSSVSDVSI